MKKWMLAIGAGMVIAMAGPVMADFVDDFESYTEGSTLSAPWVNFGTAMQVNDLGYGGGQGVNSNGASWFDSRRASGQTSATEDLVFSGKAMLSAVTNGLARHQWGMFSGSTYLIWEMNNNGTILEMPPGGGSVLFSRGVWYEWKITIDQAADTYKTEWGAVGGALATIQGPSALPAGFVLDSIMVGGIWCWDDDPPANTTNSSMDDVSLITIPEPMTMSLLGIGGLLLRRRR